ncbi:MAG: aminoacyl-histidine dipeptidase [Candidatus Fermentibacter daniensis]|nr:aminoacyl-histidine dipeptidase [Candidatus Fermentibacter daniensis]
MDKAFKAADLSTLEPSGVWKWFEAMTRIPRPSGSERQASGFLVGFAEERGLDYEIDDVGNVLIRHPGRGAASGSAPVCLQAHVDMVAEKLESSSHDFLGDPISFEIDGDWVIARETTLGADNGMGVALMLAILDDPSTVHPPLECLFTVDEERGLTGASRLDPAWLKARRMINLDSEEEGFFCIGCSGGLDVHLEGAYEPAPAPEGMIPLTVRVEGLHGGHSGMEINRWRANAIRLLAHTVSPLVRNHGCRIASLSGGSKRNAIPRTASAALLVPPECMDALMKSVSGTQNAQREEFAGIDDELTISAMPSLTTPDAVLPDGFAVTTTDLLLALHHGVEKMSTLSRDLVETSCNLAILEAGGGAVRICITVRSLLENAKGALAGRLAATARLAGFEFSTGGGYPGWKPDSSSLLLGTSIAAYRELCGAEPEIMTIHAGLECGIIGGKVGGMDMISMGPDIRDVHVPGEKVSISSTARFWSFINGLLARL